MSQFVGFSEVSWNESGQVLRTQVKNRSQLDGSVGKGT